MKHTMRFASLTALAAVFLALAGCATDSKQAAPAAAVNASVSPTATTGTAKEFYVVMPEDGRIYAFGDTGNYMNYIAHSEVPLTRTRIGAGPGGKTVVFGITRDNVKKNAPSLAEQILDGKLDGASNFHGEAFKDGRYYVFGNLKDMMAFTAFGEVPYSYTDIGVGPKGETLVWVMNKDSYAKGRPASTIERFRNLRAAK
jgi:predicted small lipoprotein YifL